MNVCIVGDGLVSLTLAKALINEGIYVDILPGEKIYGIDKSRTIGISKANLDYFNENILNIKKLSWTINKIEIFSDNLNNQKILNFENHGKIIFSMIKNHELYNFLIQSLNKNKLFRKKRYNKIFKTDTYDLVINCDSHNYFSKKYFNKKLGKDYKSHAYISIIDHKKIPNNNTAIQIFTKRGPLAFLPISNKKTSIVYSAKGSKNIDLNKMIVKYNSKYSIIKMNKTSVFKLRASNLRNYYFQNILAFGDLLHRIHPFAGQGFNMCVRDIKLLISLIKFRLKLGLEVGESTCLDFEKKARHKNFLFSNGIDLIYEFFNLESKIDNSILSSSIKFLNKNRMAKKIFRQVADKGIII